MAVDQFCLKWNNFQSSIVSAFESLQSTEDLADVTLSTEGINIKAHKIILSACSPYFRTVFKENPCSHPIVILKDILYNDLLAVLNYMYHGEVLVSKDRLHSFLQTAEVLQVSGLIGCVDVGVKGSSKPSFKQHKSKEAEFVQSAPKRAKITSRNKKQEVFCQNTEAESHIAQEKLISLRDPSANNFEIVPVDKIKTELEEDSLQTEVNVNVRQSAEMLEKPVSILETVLEVKDSPTSILERSLMSYPPTGKSPTVTYPIESSNLHHSSSELAKHLAPQKPPDLTEIDKRMQKYEHLPLSRSDLPADNQLLKTEDEEKIEVGFDIQTTLTDVNVRPPQEAQPHHSSQCGNCPHCGKVYSNQSALKYHVRFVHSGLLNLYCCHLCPEAFDYREGYKKHMVEVHSLRN